MAQVASTLLPPPPLPAPPTQSHFPAGTTRPRLRIRTNPNRVASVVLARVPLRNFFLFLKKKKVDDVIAGVKKTH